MTWLDFWVVELATLFLLSPLAYFGGCPEDCAPSCLSNCSGGAPDFIQITADGIDCATYPARDADEADVCLAYDADTCTWDGLYCNSVGFNGPISVQVIDNGDGTFTTRATLTLTISGSPAVVVWDRTDMAAPDCESWSATELTYNAGESDDVSATGCDPTSSTLEITVPGSPCTPTASCVETHTCTDGSVCSGSFPNNVRVDVTGASGGAGSGGNCGNYNGSYFFDFSVANARNPTTLTPSRGSFNCYCNITPGYQVHDNTPGGLCTDAINLITPGAELYANTTSTRLYFRIFGKRSGVDDVITSWRVPGTVDCMALDNTAMTSESAIAMCCTGPTAVDITTL